MSRTRSGAAKDKITRSLGRVVEVTAQKILDGKALSIREIASEAQCSTVTIYQTFKDKDGLTVAALRRCSRIVAPPIPCMSTKESAFEDLVGYLIARIEFLNSPYVRTLSNLQLQSLAARRFLQSEMLRTNALPHFTPLVREAVAQAHFPPCDPENLSRLILSAASYEPYMLSLWRQTDIDAPRLAMMVLEPLLSIWGRTTLSRFVHLDHHRTETPDRLWAPTAS